MNVCIGVQCDIQNKNLMPYQHGWISIYFVRFCCRPQIYLSNRKKIPVKKKRNLVDSCHADVTWRTTPRYFCGGYGGYCSATRTIHHHIHSSAPPPASLAIPNALLCSQAPWRAHLRTTSSGCLTFIHVISFPSHRPYGCAEHTYKNRFPFSAPCIIPHISNNTHPVRESYFFAPFHQRNRPFLFSNCV